MMIDTCRYLSMIGIDGIKLQLLHILKNTDLVEFYTKKTFDINGKNGSGKTSLLEALVKYFLYITSEGYYSIENVNSHYEKYNGQLRPFIHQSHFHRISQVIDNNIFFLL